MKKIKLMVALSALVGLFATSNAFAGMQMYDAKAFKAAQSEGKTVLLGFHADWCGTCKKQKPAVMKVLASEGFSDVVGFMVNFDMAKELKKELKVSKQSTLVIFKGKKEVARKMGITKEKQIKALIEKGL